jgi:predicted RecA/RadA family phage recombinase
MKNYISSGDTVTLVAPTGGVVSGTAVKIGQIVAIPAVTVAAAASFEGAVSGIFDLAKVSAQAWTVGQIIYFDSAAGLFTTTSATGNVIVGQAVAIAANPSPTGRVRLDGAVRASV